jgi:molecular chaperone DnaK
MLMVFSKVSALDKGTGREQSIRITNTGGLSNNEVERMRQEAEMYADEDDKRRQLAELMNRADNLFYSYEATIRDNAGLMDDSTKADLEEKASLLRAAMNNRNIAPPIFQQHIDELQAALFAVGSNLYRDVEDPEAVDMQIPESAYTNNSPDGVEDVADYDDDLEPDLGLDATVTAE